MSTNIRFKRSDIPGKVPSLDSIDLGELALNTADGKLFTKQEMKAPDGFAAIQKIIEIGATEVPNVLYVAKNGDDSNSGKTLGQAFLTLKKALSIATPGTTIFLKSGEYIEDNPLRVPARVSVVGDNLRNTTVRPKNPTKDIFWVYNGAYIFCMNFKGHIAPSAAVCFPPDGSAGEIVTSPYTQAVTSITTTGTGMRVDGAVTTGLRSMVCDAFTQYNQGGIGIHMLNRGNTQLVSIFTICCDISFMCENGGFCSVNLSNSSFGNYGLVSRGASEPLYRGVVKKSAGRQITFKNLAKRPNIGDGVLFADYNQKTCNRDNGLVVDGLAFDLLYEGTTQSTFSGLRYWAKDTIQTPLDQQEPTAAAIKRAQTAAKNVVNGTSFITGQILPATLGISAGSGTAERIVGEEFGIVASIIANGPTSPSLIIGPDLDAAEPEYKVLREQVLDRQSQIVDQTIDFLSKNFSGVAYVTSKCKRDLALIIDAVADDMIFGTNYKTIKAALSYLSSTAAAGYTIPSNQQTATREAFKFARDKIVPLVQEDATLLARVQASFTIIDETLANGATYINDITAYTSTNANKLVYPSLQDTDPDTATIVKNLQANKEYIKAEVNDYIKKNWPTVVAYGYNENTCKRDIGYAIDALSYDMLYGGNSQTLDAAKRYFNYASGLPELKSSEEVPATVDAFGRVQLLSQRVVILDPVQSQQTGVAQVISGLTATTQTQVNKLSALFGVFLKQLETEIVATSDFIQPNGARLNDSGLDNAYTLLQANKQAIRNDVVNYLARAYPAFDFDRVKCSRDVGYIVDSVCFDLVHGGNRQAIQAGIYYFDFNEESNVLKTVIPNQIKQTVNAYKYMKELLRDVLTCNPVPNPWQGAVPQITDLPAATGSEVVAVGNLIDIINEILQEGPNNSEDSIQRLKQPIGLTASGDINKQRAFKLLMANRQFIQAEMLAYININWYTISEGDTSFARVNTATELTLGTTTTGYPTVTYQPAGLKAIRDAVLAAKEEIKTETIKFMANSFFDNFSFNKPKCYRDVGLILDAILSDMVFDSNYKTITAAISYLRAYASEVIGAQKVQTIAALKAAKTITLARIVTPAAKNEISTRFDIILDILEKESGDGYTVTYPIPTRNNEEDIDRKTAVDILRDNTDFIKQEIVAYIDANFTLNEFDREKCSRDTGLIIDALGYDLMFISNYRSISAGRAYLRANAAKVTGNQKLATLGAFRHLKKLAKEIVKTNTLAVNSIESNMDIILDILDKGEEAVPKYMVPFPSKGRSVEFKRARDLVQKNRDFIIDEVLTYINTPGLELLKGTVTHQVDGSNNFLTNGSFYQEVSNIGAGATDDLNAMSDGDLIRISGVLFGTSTIGGYANPSIYKLANVSNGTASGVEWRKFTIVNLDGSAVTTTPGSTGRTTSMRFELIKAGTYTLPAGFDIDKCRRDLNLILDAIYYDTTYGGTLESVVAAESYFVGALSQLNPTGTQADEVTATIRAYEFLRTVVKEVAQDNTWVPTVGNTTGQVFSPNGSDGSANAAREMAVCVDFILNVLRNDSTIAVNIDTQATLPDLSWVDPKALESYQALQTAREVTQEAVTDYVDENYVLFGYDRAKCARDVGNVIEAVRYDMMFNSNFRSIVAGRSYYRAMASTVVKDQKSATLASFQYLKTKLLEIVKAVDPDNPTADESASIQRVSRSMDIILDILENGLTAEPTFLLTVPTSGTDNASNAERLKARNLIETNRAWIEDRVVAYITLNYSSLDYDETACRRDVEYILDAIYYDQTYGGNLETIIAAKAYYGGTSGVNLALGAGETAATVAAYNFLADLVEDVAEGTALTTNSDADGNAYTANQPVTANAGNGTSGDKAKTLVTIIKNYVNNPTTYTFSTSTPDIDWVSLGIRSFNTKLSEVSTVGKLKQLVTDFVDLNFAYNKDKCARDVGFLVDALCYDLLYGGNVETTQAAVAYFDGAVTPKSTIPKQIIQTVAAYERLKEVLGQVVQLKDVLPSTDNFTAKQRTESSLDIILKIISDGEAFAPPRPYVMPLPKAVSGVTDNASVVGYLNARNLIQANREFIKAETIDYIDSQATPPNYNKVKCERDIDFILDAVLYDLTYGGNLATKIAADSYKTPAQVLPVGERTATADAFTAMASVIESVALGTRIASPYQNRIVQVVSTSGSGGAATAAKNLILNVVVVAVNNQALPNTINPSTAWVDSALLTINTALQDAAFISSVKTQVVALMADKFSALNYTAALASTGNTLQVECEQDIDAVITAVRYDMMFGSNYRSQLAGRAYYRNVTGANNVLANQKDASLAVFQLVKDQISDLIATAVPQQVKTGQAGNSTAGTAAANLVQVIIDFIDADAGNDPGEIEAVTPWVDPDLVAISTSMDTSAATIKASITTYISDRFPELVYSTADCQEDIVSIIDAVRFDMMFGGNFRTISAARAYFRAQAAKAIGVQKTATLEAFRLLKEKLTDIAKTNALALDRVTERMDLLIKIVDKGEKAIPAYVVPSPTGYNTPAYLSTYGYARNLIETNRDFLKNEVLKYIVSNNPTLDFKEDKCLRDLDLILDAIYYDMTYGGNMESVIAGGAYYRGSRAGDLVAGQNPTITGDDIAATLDAYGYLKTLVKKVAEGEDVSQLQISIPQSGGAPGSVAGAQTAKNLAYVVRNLINNVGTYAVPTPTFVSPNVSWVELELKNPNDLIELYKTSDAASGGYLGRSSVPSKLTQWVSVQQEMAVVNTTTPLTSSTPSTGPLSGTSVTAVGSWTLWYKTTGSSGSESPMVVNSNALVIGRKYKVLALNNGAGGANSTFTSVGASANTVGTVFVATGTDAGGTGTVHEMFSYDVAKCERDIALIMDAVRYDMMFGTNFRTRTAAIAYWRQQSNSALSSGSTTNSIYPQKEQSRLLFTYMKTILQSLPATRPSLAVVTPIPGIANPSTAHTRIGQLMDFVIGVFGSGVTTLAQAKATLPAKPYSLPLPAGGTNNSRDLGYRAARDLIEQNREFIKAEVLAWIDQQKRENRDGFVTPFNFNRTECMEDLDLILDAIYYDMTYGGNMESFTAGLAYYAGTSQASLPADEREATIRAYNYMGTLLFNVARSVLNKSYQLAIEQVKGTSGSAETAEKLAQLVDIVINVVKGGTKQIPAKVEPDFLAGDETLAYVRIAVQEQKFELQARIADYIDAFILQYNTEKCARDVGLILDAAMYDMVLNSNFQSITAGSVYLQKAANVVTSTQIGPQLQAIKFIRDKVIEISQKPPLVKNEAAIGRITNLFDTMFDIIDKGVEVAPDIVNVPPLGAAFNENAVNAANSIIANKEFLKEEVVAYITANYKTYDQSRCSRDVGLIIDAALYDLLLNTNYNSVKAGLAYRRATSSLVVTDQLKETLGGIDFAKKKVIDLLDDADAIASITRSFELISSIIGGGSVPTLSIPLPGGSVFALPRPSGILTRDKAFEVAATELLKTSVQTTVKGAVNTWITSQISGATTGSIWDGFTYTGTRKDQCEEDIVDIMKAIAYDLTYGGNMESMVAGRAYYAGTALASLTNAAERPTTLAVYTYLADYIRTLIEGVSGASTQVALEAQDLILQIRNLVDSAENNVAAVSLPDQTWADPLTQEISSFLVDDKKRLQDVIIDYVNNIASYTGNTVQTPTNYDQDKCRRDVGLVLDAVRYDLMFGTNFRTISAGRSYARSFANVITGAQNSANINSFIELKERVLGKKLTSVARAAGNGQFTCASPATVDTTPLTVNQPVRVSGVYGTGNTVTLANYPNLASQPKTYYIIATNGTTTFTLSETVGGAAIVTTGVDTAVPLGLTFEIRQAVEPLDSVITQGLLDVTTLTANDVNTPLVIGREYKIDSIGTQTVSAGGFVVGGKYKIVTVGSTNFQNHGAANNTIGTEFTATDSGSGTGTALFITDYTLMGAANNNVGTVFRATRDTIATTSVIAPAADNDDTTINVANTTNFPTVGTIRIGNEIITYTGKTATTFTGCTRGSGAIALTVGNVVTSLTAGTGQVKTISIREAAERLFNLFNSILSNQSNIPAKQGGSGTFYNLTAPSAGTNNASVAAILTARDQINAARQDLEDDLIDWIGDQITATNGNFDSTFGTYWAASSYAARTKCRADIKLILDAITYDLTFGGNTETVVAGKAYYDGTALGAEKLATIDAYKQFKVFLTAVAGANGGNTGRVQTLIDNLITYIDQKNIDPKEIPADTSWVDSELYVFSDKLKIEADTVASSVTNYINNTFPELVGFYDVAKCQRDIKLVIDAVRWDMMFNSNFRTIVAAKSYFRSQVTTGNFTTGPAGSQKTATIDAFTVVKVTLDELVKSDDVAKTRVAALMDIVLGILNQANLTAVDAYVISIGGIKIPYGGTPNAVDIGFLNARDRIEENREYIVAEMKAYLAVLFAAPPYNGTPPSGYTQAECIRDVRLILDALRYDMTYGGNLESVTAGKAYYDGTVLNNANAGHIAATESAYTRLATIVEQIALNTNVTESSGFSGPNQIVANSAGSAVAAAQAKALIDTVKSYVGTSTANDVAEVRPSTSWVDNNLALIASTMLDRKAESLPLQVTDYIDEQFPALSYDKVKCSRDVRLVVDAVRYDMMFGTNFRSWTAGKAYYRNMTSAGVVTTTQKAATLASFRYLKGLLVEIAGNNVTAMHRVKGAMNVVIDTLEFGETTRNANSSLIAAAVDAIDNNRASLLTAMGTWLDAALYGSGQANAVTGYNKTTCLRDIGYLIDAIKYDLTYGGNMETVVAGKAYYDGAVLASGNAGHITATKAAFTQLGTLIKALSGVDQYAVDPMIDALINNVNALIDDDSLDTEVYADASWAEVPIQEVSVAIRSQIETIKTDVTNYVTTNFPTLVYDSVKCARDVGLLTDAVRWDMLFNSNFRSITAGRSYYRTVLNLAANALQNVGGVDQKAATVAAFTYLKDVLLGIAAGNAIAQERLTTNMDIILQIIESGLGNQADPTISYPANGISIDAGKAKNILIANKDFIKDEIISYINSNFNAVFYDEEKCARDVELITTAIAYDIVTNSNYQTITAARGYLRANAGNVLTDQQKHITLIAMKYLKNLLINYVGGNATAIARVKSRIDIVIKTIYDEVDTNLPALSIPTNTVTTTTTNTLQTNRAAIVNSVTAFLAGTGAYASSGAYTWTGGDSWTGLGPTKQAKCQRDVGFIVDALTHDLTYGGNWATVINAISYFVGTTAQLGTDPDEKAATLAAYEELKDIIATFVPGQTTEAEDLIDIIKGVVNLGLSAAPAIEYPELLGSDNALEAARNVLISNVANAKAKVIRYANDRAYFVYDVVKCERDIGLILDAVYTDVITNSNYLSVTAGNSYLRASASGALSAPQKWAILAGLTHAKSVLSNLVKTNADLPARIRAKLSVVIDIINDEKVEVGFNGANPVDNPYVVLSFPYNGPNQLTSTTTNTLQANRTTIVNSLFTWLTTTYDPDGAGTTFNPGSFSLSTTKADKCKRDTGFIIDALTHDLTYGGNLGTRIAAESYYVGAVLQLGAVAAEKTATLAAYEQLKTEIATYVPGQTTQANALIDAIKTAIDTGTIPNPITPSFAGASAVNLAARTTLVNAKENSVFRILDFINSRPYLAYDAAKCQRDVIDILDAIRFDVMYSSNFKSITAGQAYLRSYSKVVTQEQKQATIGALYYVKKRVTDILAADSNVASASVVDARSYMDIIIDILDRGVDATPVVYIVPLTADSDAGMAVTTIVNNTDFIKAEVRAWIERNYPELDYDKIKCERDVVYILNALRYDLAFGGNSATREAGLSYWEGNALTLGTGTTVTSTLVTSGNFVIGQKYQIAAISSGGTPVNTVFTDIGASSNTVGVVFTATGAGEGNGQAYLVVGVEEEKLATVGAYAFLADLVKALLDNNYSVTQQTAIAKGTYATSPGPTPGVTAADLSTTAKTLITNIKNMVNSANLAAAQAVVAETLPVTAGDTDVSTVLVNAKTGANSQIDLPALTTAEINKAFINTSTGTFAAGNANNVQFFVYNRTKCARDVGFVVDALAFDAFFGGNKEIREAALQYAYKGGLVIPEATKVPTVGGFERLVAIIDDIVDGTAITRSTGFNGALSQTTLNPSTSAIGDAVALKAQVVIDVLNGETAPVLVEPDAIANKTADAEFLVIRELVKDSTASIAAQTITYINETYAGFGYLQDTCKRDVGLTLDAVAYDLVYGGNSRTKFAAEQYFSGGRFQIPADSKSATVACFVYLDALVRKVIVNDPIVTFQNYVDQDKSNQQATQQEITNVAGLFDAFTDILTNGYISVLQLDATFNGSVDDNTYATFHQVSTITTTGHTLEWVGTGIDVDSALPYNGGVPKPQNQLVSEKGGFINFTSTDEKGDFRIGPDLTIKRDSGSIVGRAFNKSLLGVVTPYILALQS